jgi:hypothetical protein
MQSKNRLARLRSLSPRSAAKPALYLGFMIAAASCAAELQDPASYTVANETATATGGTTPAATGGIGGGGASATGGTKATGGTGGPTGGAASNVTTVDPCVKTAFSANSCTLCHSASGKASAANLDLTGADAAIIAALKDVAAVKQQASNAAACGTMLINSANPAESVLLKRIRGSGDCGPLMPFAGHPWSDNDRKCIEDWVMKF